MSFELKSKRCVWKEKRMSINKRCGLRSILGSTIWIPQPLKFLSNPVLDMKSILS
jgi:hypothetical protein